MPPEITSPNSLQATRLRCLLTGQVQGVGFRPFVYRLALDYGLSGFVQNDATGVVIEAQGPASRLHAFIHDVQERKPALAIIDRISSTNLPPAANETTFRIIDSRNGAHGSAQVTVDTALCPDCIREMLYPADRRAGYALINCTNCGPRYSIIRQVPYDRPNTTMASFAMCERCREEYTNPSDRRFHAQPIACHDCGPRLSLIETQGNPIAQDPILEAIERLDAGKILAIKGLGGFHLAVRADDHAAVDRLRQLKKRDYKPFALMCADMRRVRQLVRLSLLAAAVVASPASPIVLAPRQPGEHVAPAVAPGNHRLGVMLPYTPIHHLLFHHARGRFDTLVMTSGNASDEPLAIDNAEALLRLGGLCDAILLHDRPIERCVDDSVVIDMGDSELLPVRRARGYVPSPIALPVAAAEPGLALGGEMKNTVAAVRDDQVILSQHLGNLTHPLAFSAFKRAVADLCGLFTIAPKWVAHDLHPVYLSTCYANELASRLSIPAIAVQHHHAHAAALMAEHGVTDSVLAVICDGTGYGADGTIWGGELLLTNLAEFKRLGRMRPIPLAGGDAAARDARRSALGLLFQALGAGFADHPAAQRLLPDPNERDVLDHMIRRNFNCIPTSSAGRVFDGVAALLGLCFHNDYDAQAPITLESAAFRADTVPQETPLFDIHDDQWLELDFARLVIEIVDRISRGWPAEHLAATFHDQLSAAWDAAVAVAAERTGIRCVALSGGVFCNQRFTISLQTRLQQRGLRVLRHRLVPPNDGGLAYGQAAVAAARARRLSPIT